MEYRQIVYSILGLIVGGLLGHKVVITNNMWGPWLFSGSVVVASPSGLVHIVPEGGSFRLDEGGTCAELAYVLNGNPTRLEAGIQHAFMGSNIPKEVIGRSLVYRFGSGKLRLSSPRHRNATFLLWERANDGAEFDSSAWRLFVEDAEICLRLTSK